MKFKSDIEVQAGLKDSSGSAGTSGQLLSSTISGTSWINPPAVPGSGGSSQVFYFNGGTASGVVGYQQMSTVANTGTAADFSINANGYIASFLTDVASPNQLNIPAGNWNFEIYMSASSSGGSPSFYVELYKYSSSTFTLIASSSATPEGITNGTAIDLYTTALAVPTTILLATDRLAVRVYVTHSGRIITMHTQNGHLSEVITTFSTGLTALNGLTAQVQYFAVGTAGTDFGISSATNTHTFNLPTASASNRGALNSADWITFNSKANASGTTNYVSKFTGTTTLGNSLIYDNGTNVGINNNTPNYALDVIGSASISSNIYTNNVYAVSFGTVGYANSDTLINTYTGKNIVFSVNNSEKARITSTGSFGIGTTSPAAKLTINTTTNENVAIGSLASIPTGRTLILQTSATGGSIETYSSLTGGYVNTLINPNGGNVGIGTTTPGSILEIKAADPNLTINQSTSTNNSGIKFQSTGGPIGNITAQGNNGNMNISMGPSAGWGGYITFQTDLSERMRITAAGNVGIGTTSPSYKFQTASSVNSDWVGSFYNTSTTTPNGLQVRVGVSSAAQALGVYTDGIGYTFNVLGNGNVGIGTTSPNKQLTFAQDDDDAIQIRRFTTSQGNPSAGTGISWTWADASTNNETWAAIRVIMPGYGNSNMTFSTTPNGGGSNLAERMRITDTGNVGIGTTSPSAKLDVFQTNSGISGWFMSGQFSAANYPMIRLGATTPDKYLSLGNDGDGSFNVFTNGSASSLGSLSLKITPTGNVGIGTSSPIYTLDVNGTSNITNSLYVGGNLGVGTTMPITKVDIVDTMTNPTLRLAYVPMSGYGGGGNIDFVGGSTDYVFGAISWKNGTTVQGQVDYSGFGRTMTLTSQQVIAFRTSLMERMRIDSMGQVGIGTSSPMYTLHVNGSVAGTSAYINLSDERYKKDILPIENALDKVLSLNGVTFNWDKEFNPRVNLDDTNHIGLIAQEVERVIPQAVSTASDDNQTKSVAYSDLVPVLIEAIKEQQKQIEELKKLINK